MAAFSALEPGVPGEPGFGLLGWMAGVPGKPGFGLLGWNRRIPPYPAVSRHLPRLPAKIGPARLPAGFRRRPGA